MRNIQIFKIIPFGGKQMNRILAVTVLLGMIGCSGTQPYVTNISPAGEQGILVEKCKVQFNSLTQKFQLNNVTPVMFGWVQLQWEKQNRKKGQIRITTSSRLSSQVAKL